MMDEREFKEAVLQLFRENPRFGPDAYLFVVQALELAQDRLGRSNVSARELLEAFRLHALRSHGPQAGSILRSWSVRSWEDVGQIVFLLVDRGLLQASPTGRREEFAVSYSFAAAFPEPRPSRTLLRVLCHLFLDHAPLQDLEKHFRCDDSLDPAWLSSLALDPFITNDPPADKQVTAFHGLLEETLAAREEGRFDDALRAYEGFARTALNWWPKPDVMLHDFLIELEPYCSEFAGILLRKFHLTPDPPPGYGWDDASQPGATSLPIEDDPTRPERDFSGLHGFGQAPPVAQEIHVYVDLQLVDTFLASRAASPKELEEEAQQRPRARAALGDRLVQETRWVHKHFHKNLLLTTTAASGGA